MKRRFDSSLINFLKELKAFHGSSGSSVVSFPSISGRNVNLYKLYKIVTANGGFDKVSLDDKWALILEELNIPEECANASEVVKQIYQRYLERYERSRKKDGTAITAEYDVDDLGDDEIGRSGPMYKSRRNESYFDTRQSSFHETPRNVNIAQGISSMPPNFSRLYKSLLCGLPNEFDLGVSACLALSLNDSRIPLQPCHFSLFIDLLCAHTGVFGDDKAKLSKLYADWRKSDRLTFFKFWSTFVDDDADDESLPIKDLLYCPDISQFLEGEAFVQKESSVNAQHQEISLPLSSKEGFIVEMISSVFRNLSFDAYNAALMANNTTLLRFLLLGSRCQYRNISTLCLDTIARLAPTLTLETLELIMDCGSSLLTDAVKLLLESNDRAKVIVGAEILASLCQNDSNFDELCSFIDSSLCNKLFQCLLVPDINLVVNCAEAIYQISELGPSPCDIIAANERHLTMILALTTIEAVAFGPDALVNIKVVMQPGAAMPVLPPQQQHRMPPRPMQPMPVNARPLPPHFSPQFSSPPNSAPLPPNFNNQAPPMPFVFASNWLRSNFESFPGPPAHGAQPSESLLDVYNDYHKAALRSGCKAVFDNIQHFMECVIRTYPFVAIKSPPPGNIETARVYGIKKMSTPGPVAPYPQPVGIQPVLQNGDYEKHNILAPNGAVPVPSQPKRPLLPKLSTENSKISADQPPILNGGGDHSVSVNNNANAQNSIASGVLHVVGTPITASAMIESERRQHELSIVRVENKPSQPPNVEETVNGNQKASVLGQTNGTHGSEGNNNTLDGLLDGAEEEKVINNSTTAQPAVISNGTKLHNNSNGEKPLPKSIEEQKDSLTTTTTKGQNGNSTETGHHINGFVHSVAQANETTNGFHESSDSLHGRQPSVDEASLISADSNSRSGVVFASCADSESAASFGGGEASLMSTVSDVDSRDTTLNKRAPIRSCPSVNNADSRSAIVANSTGFNTNSSSALPVHTSGPAVENENSVPTSSSGPYINGNSNITNSAIVGSTGPVLMKEHPQQPVVHTQLPFPCRWGSCQESFHSADQLHRHFVGVHVAQISSSYGARSPCQWTGCVWPIPRLKWSLVTHVKDVHLNGSPMTHPPRIPHPDCEVPPDAGLRAVLTNFCQTTPFQPPVPGFEGPVTKQMRLAGGLILRNIAKHSANGKRFIHRHMNELVAIAFSGIESSSAISAALEFADQPLL